MFLMFFNTNNHTDYFTFTLTYNMSKNAFPSYTASQVLPFFLRGCLLLFNFASLSTEQLFGFRYNARFSVLLFTALSAVCIQRGGGYTQ